MNNCNTCHPYRSSPKVLISLWKPRTFTGFIKRLYRKFLIFWFKSWNHRFIRCKFCNSVISVSLKNQDEYYINIDLKQRMVIDMHWRTECPYFKSGSNRPSPLPIPMPKICNE